MNKIVNLALSGLEISKLIIYKFWYDNEKRKQREETKLCCVTTDNMKVEDIYPDI